MSEVRAPARKVVSAGRPMHAGVGGGLVRVFPVRYRTGQKPDVLRRASRPDRADPITRRDLFDRGRTDYREPLAGDSPKPTT